MRKIVVSEEFINQRIDIVISQCSEYSRSKAQKMIDQGLVLVNEELVKNSYRLELDDEICLLDGTLDTEITLKPTQYSLDIVYEDEYLLVVNKPKGLVVHPGAGYHEVTLASALLYYCNQLSSDPIRPGIVHRLDKDTSGLLLIAKNDLVHAKLSDMLSKREIKREYLAVVSGRFPHSKAKVDAPIGRDKVNRQQMCITDKGKNAVTHFTRLEVYDDSSLLLCQLETGRTHQIRVHAKYMNYSVYGDPVYGYKKDILDCGQLLHAFKISFIHPITNQFLEFKGHLPDVFVQYLKERGSKYAEIS